MMEDPEGAHAFQGYGPKADRSVAGFAQPVRKERIDGPVARENSQFAGRSRPGSETAGEGCGPGSKFAAHLAEQAAEPSCALHVVGNRAPGVGRGNHDDSAQMGGEVRAHPGPQDDATHRMSDHIHLPAAVEPERNQPPGQPFSREPFGGCEKGGVGDYLRIITVPAERPGQWAHRPTAHDKAVKQENRASGTVSRPAWRAW